MQIACVYIQVILWMKVSCRFAIIHSVLLMLWNDVMIFAFFFFYLILSYCVQVRFRVQNCSDF